MTDPTASGEKLKTCTKCGQTKPIDSFSKMTRRKDGHQSSCKDCFNAYGRSQYRKHAEKRQAQKVGYRVAHIDRIRELTNKRNKAVYHTKGKARTAVAQALKKGLIERETCRDCDSSVVDFHHTKGYSEENWLTGVWLCRKHHAAEHVLLREYERLAA